MSDMSKLRISALILLILSILIAFFVYSSEKNSDSKFPFRYGLDLDGGTHLTFRANTNEIPQGDINSAMDALRRTVERRINVFGVSEPIVQVEKGGVFSNEEDQNRLIVELPGITDVKQAVDAIGRTPVLEFRLVGQDLSSLQEMSEELTLEERSKIVYDLYKHTGLGGKQLKRASVVFDQISTKPIISIEFNDEGAELFAKITKDNIGNFMGIFLDGQIISNPVIQQEIIGGKAQITGDFDIEEARKLAQDLNLGALPVPIELIETQTVGASLGQETLSQIIKAFFIAFAIISIFMIIWYRLMGLVAVLSLAIYVAVMFALFKIIPVTLTSSGLAGFILSIGMAVDANVLIFERIKDELKQNLGLTEAVKEGFKRAWLPIRDGNLSSLISAVVLYWLSATALVKGFALVFGLGVLVSMLTAVIISRTFLLAITSDKVSKIKNFLFNSGFKK